MSFWRPYIVQLTNCLHLQACCTVPPAKAEYDGKGTYIEIDGMKTCECDDTLMG